MPLPSKVPNVELLLATKRVTAAQVLEKLMNQAAAACALANFFRAVARMTSSSVCSLRISASSSRKFMHAEVINPSAFVAP